MLSDLGCRVLHNLIAQAYQFYVLGLQEFRLFVTVVVSVGQKFRCGLIG